MICADQIDRTRSNRAFCQRHGIRLSGPRLGRPKNDPELVAAERRQFIDDQRRRNAVEGKIGQGKRRYGLGLIREKLPATQGSSIAMNVLVMNLQKLLELLGLFYSLATPYPGRWRRLEYSHCASDASESCSVMIGLRVQAGVLFVEADPGFTFSGGPTCHHECLEALQRSVSKQQPPILKGPPPTPPTSCRWFAKSVVASSRSS